MYCALRDLDDSMATLLTLVLLNLSAAAAGRDRSAAVDVSELEAAWPWPMARRRRSVVARFRRSDAIDGRTERGWDKQSGSVRVRRGSRTRTAAPPGRQESGSERGPTRIVAAAALCCTLLLRGRLRGECFSAGGDDRCSQRFAPVRAPHSAHRELPVGAQAAVAVATRLAGCASISSCAAACRRFQFSATRSSTRPLSSWASAGVLP